MPKKDETLSRAKAQALYLCGLPAFVVSLRARERRPDPESDRPPDRR